VDASPLTEPRTDIEPLTVGRMLNVKHSVPSVSTGVDPPPLVNQFQTLSP
jgi:hypothetical protein